jgi:hypothetical protein
VSPDRDVERALASQSFQILVDHKLAFERDVTRKAYAYWNTARGQRSMPKRSDLTARGMKPFLRNVVIAEPRKLNNEWDYFVRLAGTEVEKVIGHVNGKLIGSVAAEELKSRWRFILDQGRVPPRPARCISRVLAQKKTWLTAEVFVAPLSEDGQRVSMVFGCLDFWAAI